MTDYGVTDQGFRKKTREKILEDMKLRAKNKFGDDINVEDDSPLGIILGVLSWEIYLKWEGTERDYNAGYIDTAISQNLDNVVKYAALSRKEATKATGTVTFSADQDTIIPYGFKVETDTDPAIQFETTEEVTIDSDGSVDVEIQAIEAGSDGNVSSSTITVITNPISGLDSVTNNNATTGGDDQETDMELRERYENSLDRPGGGTVNSIHANILEETDATACIVLENTSLFEDANGLPGKSFEAILLGGSNQNIAEAIFEKKSAGMEAHGDISVDLTDDAGLTKTISFSRATQIDIYVDVTLTTDSTFLDDGNTQVEDAIIEYIGGTKADNETVEGNLSIGNDVVYTKLIDVAYNVEGVTDVSITVGTADNPSGTSNISIAASEVARTDSTKVDVS